MKTLTEKIQGKRIAELNKRVKSLEKYVTTLCTIHNIALDGKVKHRRYPPGLYAL